MLTKVMFCSEQNKTGDDFGPVSAAPYSDLILDGRFVHIQDILSMAISCSNESRCHQSCDLSS